MNSNNGVRQAVRLQHADRLIRPHWPERRIHSKVGRRSLYTFTWE